MVSEKQNQILLIAQKKGIIRARDLDAYDIPREHLRRLVRKGKLIQIGRGWYINPGSEISENRSLVEVSLKIPNGTICLLSALRYHGLTTQNPHKVWIAIDPKARKPVLQNFPIHIVRFSGDALVRGVENRVIEGKNIKLYNPGKTVADCFKYRNKIGTDVAVEALKECLNQNKSNMDAIWDYAKVCRVRNVMMPYLESIR